MLFLSLFSRVVRRPKSEPRETADIPPSNPDDPIDLESSPEHLLRKRVGKRKQAEVEAEGQPEKKVQRKKITRRGNLDAFIANPIHENAGASEHEMEKTAGVENHVVEEPTDFAVDVEKFTSPETVDAGTGRPQTPELVAQDAEKEKSAQENPVRTSPSMASSFMPENIEKVSVEDQGSFSYADKNSPIRPYETLGDYYYRTYSERNASEIHVHVWNLKKGDTFSDWRVCRDQLQGPFRLGRINFKRDTFMIKLVMHTLKKLPLIRLRRTT
ncbi:hypothetical protein Hanom_Chr08g00724541 [Helianthus anomalus]